MRQKLASLYREIPAIRRMIRSPSRKPLVQVTQEFAQCYREHGRFPLHYLHQELYHSDVGDVTRYLGHKMIEWMDNAGDTSPARPILDNKVHFHLHFQGVLALPPYLGYTHRDHVYLAGSKCLVERVDALRVGLRNLLQTTGNGVIAKPLCGRRGIGILRLRPGISAATLDEKVTHLRRAAFVLEGEVKQHPEMDRLFPNCLNTIRFVNGILPNGEVRHVCGVLRMGTGNAHIDNTSRGGIFIGINMETGELCPQAMRYRKFGEGRFASHPDTGVEFKSFRIPHFEDILPLAEKAVRHLPHPLAGWDIGIGLDGPVLIEGNARPDPLGLELALGGLRYNEALNDLAEGYGIPRQASCSSDR